MQKRGISSFTLSCIAMVTMMIDHLYFIFPDMIIFKCIGRIAFPIFVYLLVEGYYHTSDFKKYAIRLLIFGVISEIPFNLMVTGNLFDTRYQNVMFELAFALVAIKFTHSLCECIEREKLGEGIANAMFAGIMMVLAEVFKLDYGLKGILLAVLFTLARRSSVKGFMQFIAIISVFFIIYRGSIIRIILTDTLTLNITMQWLCILALPLIWMHNGKRGNNSTAYQYFKYSFYPLHILIIGLLRTVL